MSNTVLIPADGQPISTVDELNDVLVRAAGKTSGDYEIDLAAGANIALTAELKAINLQAGVTLDIKGNGATLDGQNATRGLFVYSGIVVNDRYGCLGHFRKGMCDNGRTIRRDDIERRVLAGLTDKLVSPEAVVVAVRAFAEETNRQNHERRVQAEASRRALEKIERSIKGIIDAIADGMYQLAMKARMEELAQQKAEIEAQLAEAPADLPDVHPNIAEHYRAKVIHLGETRARDGAGSDTFSVSRSIQNGASLHDFAACCSRMPHQVAESCLWDLLPITWVDGRSISGP